MRNAYMRLDAWKTGMELAREVHIACATYTSQHPDDLLRDMRREASLLPAMVAEAAVRPPDESPAMLVETLAALARVETIGALILELGHLKADQFEDVNDAAVAFEQAVHAMLAEAEGEDEA